MRGLLQNLIEDVQDVDPVEQLALAERPRLDLAQLLDELGPVTSLEFVDEVLAFRWHFRRPLLQATRVHFHGEFLLLLSSMRSE